jgi:hypothetical protein
MKEPKTNESKRMIYGLGKIKTRKKYGTTNLPENKLI